MKSTTEQLRYFMDKYEISIRDTAQLVGLSVDTIKAYLANPKSKRFRLVPKGTLKILKYAYERKINLVSHINKNFEEIITEMENFLFEEYHVDIQNVRVIKKYTSLSKNPSNVLNITNVSSAKKFHGLLNRLKDVWIDYINLDLEGSIHKININENEELQKIIELQNSKHLTKEDRIMLSHLMKKHNIASVESINKI